MWTQTTKGVKMKGRLSPAIYPRQAINHFENHGEISNKMNLFRNLQKVYSERGGNVFNFLPLTFDYNLDREDFQDKVGHFTRYFKALRMWNCLQERRDLDHVPDKDFEDLFSRLGHEDSEQGFREKMADTSSKGGSFNLNNFYLRVLHENIKKAPSDQRVVDEKDLNQKDAPRRKTFKKLLHILDYPCVKPDDDIPGILAQSKGTTTSSQKPDSVPQSSTPFEESLGRQEIVRKARERQERDKLKDIFRARLFGPDREALEFPKEGDPFRDHYHSSLPASFNQGRNVWLLKVTSYNRGFGIELFSDLDSFFKHLFNFWIGYQEQIKEEDRGALLDQESSSNAFDAIYIHALLHFFIVPLHTLLSTNRRHPQVEDAHHEQEGGGAEVHRTPSTI